ncbi:MAG: CHAT domain-containing protein [Chloroflexota bacterium]|nr:MAG: CHAT domain-containing protein [Chloroflexota bacterium]
MPIPDSQINRAWVEIPKSATVREVQQRVPRDQRRIQWIVTPIAAQDFAVYRVIDMIEFLTERLHVDAVTESLLNAPLENLGDFLKTYTRTAVERSTNWDDVREHWSQIADPPLVVLENTKIIGILLVKTLGGSGADVDFLDQAPASEPKSANGGTHAKPPLPIPDRGESKDAGEQPSILEAEKGGSTKPPRQINVRFEPPEQKDSPLQVGDTYTLSFSVELEKLAEAIAAADVDEARFFPENVAQVEIIVQLISDDFEIFTSPQKLIVPREGKSKNRARFDLSPKRNGVGELTAVFLKDGNAVQAIELKLNVGEGSSAIAESKTLGRTVEAAGAVQPRGLSLWIKYVGEGFQVTVLGPTENTVFMLPLQLQQLEQAIDKARAALKQIVEFKDKSNMVYQTDTEIDAAVKNKTLPILARAGFMLFQNIFMNPGSSQAALDFAKRFRELARGEPLNIQINSQQMMLPWGILYMADRFDPDNIQPELFLGLKHIIEHQPMEEKMDFAPSISSNPQLTVSLNLNRDIDKQMNFPLIKNQEKYWAARAQKGGVKVLTRASGDELMSALESATTPDQITYFYCHALSKNLAEGGADASLLQLGENETLKLEDLRLFAPIDIRWNGRPLVFLNACESAELSPLFYNGFMPYFVAKGARGMIGTECSVPALFALDWAGKFFDQFLAGKAVGQVFLDLRREYFFKHNNILGLLYALYCDADTRVQPALA